MYMYVALQLNVMQADKLILLKSYLFQAGSQRMDLLHDQLDSVLKE